MVVFTVWVWEHLHQFCVRFHISLHGCLVSADCGGGDTDIHWHHILVSQQCQSNSLYFVLYLIIVKLFHLYRDSLKAFLRKSNCVACITGVPFNRVCQLNIEASILFESNNSPWKTLLISMERHQKCSLNISVLNVSNKENKCLIMLIGVSRIIWHVHQSYWFFPSKYLP